ncbi:MAG TPA: acyl-CoA dehydrogenase family protein [Solirubrobacteraceae bacterium]|nr:acyl-CoA dehydrogenase family protein [Solirubrobacteraceae bacterium]
MDFTLTDEQHEIAELARAFTAREITPHAAEWDRDHHWPREVIETAHSLGLTNVPIPECYGGIGLGTLETVIVAEEIARGCAGVASSLTLNDLVIHALLCGGDEAQLDIYMSRLSAGAFAAYGMTEPGAGSDIAGIRTRAVRSGDEWVLNGSKMWITNAPAAEFFVIFAKTDADARHHGISAFVVERDTDGLTVGAPLPKLGQRAAPAAEVFLEDVCVGSEALLGAERAGFEIAMYVFDRTRPVISAIAVGLMSRCLEEAVAYATERETMGSAIIRHQAIGHKLARIATDAEAARLLTRKAAWLADQGQANTLGAAYAKAFAGDAAMAAAVETVQVFGGVGYSTEFPAEKLMRDAKVLQIYEGTSEIQRNIVVRELARGQGRRAVH